MNNLIKDFVAGMKGEAPAKPRKTGRYRRMCWSLKPGFAWNPLTGYPRNKGCFCGSGVKAKRCCLPKLTRCIRAQEAQAINQLWPSLLTGHQTIKPR